MPPHELFIETHLGGGAVMLQKRRASRNIGIDQDHEVISAWRDRNDPTIEIVHGDAVGYLLRNRPDRNALVFSDPPYWPGARRRQRCYRCDYSEIDHRRLIGVLAQLDCAVMITGYPNAAYDEWLTDWHVTEYPNCTQAGIVLERAWTNYAPPDILHDYDHLGMDFREREALKRRRNSHIRRLQRATPLERNAILADMADAFPEEMKLAVGRNGE